MTAFDACRSYLAKVSPAISGQGGSNPTLRAACECVRFGLPDTDAMALLREYNRRCQPPWTEKELAHKLADARRKAGGQLRTVLQPRPAARIVWKIERKTPNEPMKAQPIPPIEPIKPSEPLTGLWIVKPGEPIPAQFVDVLRTWSFVQNHPKWRNHPQIKTK